MLPLCYNQIGGSSEAVADGIFRDDVSSVDYIPASFFTFRNA